MQVESSINHSRRLPPHDNVAERSVLGAMLFSPDAVVEAFGLLEPDHFYRPGHARIFGAMQALFEESEPIDEVTVQARLKEAGELESVGGASFLATLGDGVPSSANAGHYAKIVREQALKRRVIAVGSVMVSKGYSDTSDVEELIDDAESSIFQLNSDVDVRAYVPINETIKDAFVLLEKRCQDKTAITGVASGFNRLDHMTGGFQPSDLIIVAGRPSMGKTALALNMAQHAAVCEDKKVLIFSLEMSRDQLTMRMLCSEARIDSTRMRGGFLGDADWPKLSAAADSLSKASIHIDDTGAISLTEVRAKCRRIQAEKGLDLVIIDYLQLMRGKVKGDSSREREISEISRGLKALARELDVPVIALSQLNRALEQRQDKRPMLSDLRESGAIEQDADVIAFVYRDDYYNAESEDRGLAEVIVGKQRNGATGKVKLSFLNQYTKFENLT